MVDPNNDENEKSTLDRRRFSDLSVRFQSMEQYNPPAPHDKKHQSHGPTFLGRGR
jgi:hypothetical protein